MQNPLKTTFFKLQLTLVVDYLNSSSDFYGPAEIYFSSCFRFYNQFESHGKTFLEKGMTFVNPQQIEEWCSQFV